MQSFNLEQFVSTFVAATDEAKRVMFAEVLQCPPDQQQDVRIFEIGSRLMYRGESRWAEVAFAAAMTIPNLRDTAEYERAVLWSLQGKLAPAIEAFSAVNARAGLAPQQKFYVSRQYARIGDFSTARRLMDEAVLGNQALFEDSLSDLQFFRFIEKHSEKKIFADYASLSSSYDFASDEKICFELERALESKTPFSIIRIGDGEGIHIRLSAQDEAEYCALYKRGRAEIHRIWYAGTQLLNTPEWAVESMRVQAAYRNADCLGMLHETGLRHEFLIGSPRGVPALYNMVRFLHQIKDSVDRPRMLCNPNIHRSLLLSGDMNRIIKSRKFVGLISCYADLPDRLKQTFGLDEVDFFKTSGEFIARQSIEGDDTSIGFAREFMDRHYEVCHDLQNVREGELYLVTGGIWGRLYCDLIKRGGGIAIEIGSVADIWMNVGTRAFSASEAAFTLTNGPADDHHSRMASLHKRVAAG